MDNRIVIEPASKLREIARQSLKGNWKAMFVGALIYFGLLDVIAEVLGYFFSVVKYVQLPTGQSVPVELDYASGIYSLLVMGPVTCGFCMFLLAYFRSKKIDYALTFEGFSMFGKTFSLFVLFSVKVFLWSLLFVIPGFVAAFRYSQCFYLRVDHPEWTSSACIKESKRLMKGNKFKLFSLELSFFGWFFLANTISYVILLFDVSGFAGVIVLLIACLPSLIVSLYLNMAATVFYEIVTGNLVVLNQSQQQ